MKSHYNKLTKFKAYLGATVLTMSFMAVSSPDAGAMTAGYYTTHSKLSQGSWVRIKIEASGIYQITYDQLKEWGFADPSKVHVYGQGGTALASYNFDSSIADDISLTYTLHSDSKVYFYAQNNVSFKMSSATTVTTQRNYYSDDTYYLLSDREVDASELPKAAPVYPAEDGRRIYSTHINVQYREDEVQHPTEGGAHFLGHDLVVGQTYPYTFEVRDMDISANNWTKAIFRVNYAARNSRSTPITITTPNQITVPVSTASTQNAMQQTSGTEAYTNGYASRSFVQQLPDGVYTFSLSAPSAGQEFMAVDAVSFLYPRANVLADDIPSLDMYLPSASANYDFTLRGPANTVVLNVSRAYDVFPHTMRYDETTGTLTGSVDRSYGTSALPSCHLMAFDPSRQQMSVQYAGTVDNQNLHGLSTPDMVIITTDVLMPYAQQLAEAHRTHDGMDVLVVDHKLLFNEFSSTIPDAMAYRRFLKMLYDRNPAKLKNILFYGPTHWDNRHILFPQGNNMLSFQTTEASYTGDNTRCFVSDAFFGMLEDNFSYSSFVSTPMSVPVGRIPVQSGSLAQAANTKIINYMKSTPPVSTYGSVLVVSDDGDSNTHISQAEEAIDLMTSLQPAITPTRAHCYLYPMVDNQAKFATRMVAESLRKGAGLFLYVGHATAQYLTENGLWNNSIVASTDYEVPPLAMLSTCDTYTFDQGNQSIAEKMLYKENGGMIGIIAAARTVYSLNNQYLALAVAKRYATASAGATVGSIWTDARNDVVTARGTTTTTCVNTMSYNLCGDPALRIPAPDYKVIVTEVDGEDITGKDVGYKHFEPYKPFTVSGSIVNANGNIVPSFNGKMTLILHEAEYKVPIDLSLNPNDTMMYIPIVHEELVNTEVDVINGRFEARIATPAPMHEGTFNSLTMHAASTDSYIAHGQSDVLSIYAPATIDIPDDCAGPTIDSFDADLTDTPRNGLVSFSANGTVSSLGLNTSSAMGAASSLIIDNMTDAGNLNPLLTVDADGQWTLSASVSSLSDGIHTACLTIADNAGRKARCPLTFVIDTAHKNMTLTADVKTVRDRVTFDISDAPATYGHTHLIVADRHGNTVYRQEGATFPLTVDFSGLDLPDGHYDVSVQMSGDDGYGSTTTLPIVLINR